MSGMMKVKGSLCFPLQQIGRKIPFMSSLVAVASIASIVVYRGGPFIRRGRPRPLTSSIVLLCDRINGDGGCAVEIHSLPKERKEIAKEAATAPSSANQFSPSLRLPVPPARSPPLRRHLIRLAASTGLVSLTIEGWLAAPEPRRHGSLRSAPRVSYVRPSASAYGGMRGYVCATYASPDRYENVNEFVTFWPPDVWLFKKLDTPSFLLCSKIGRR